jgi:presenilin-like A22 family membrane protease
MLVAALLWKPKWWLVDLGGLLMGAGVIAIMGISFPIPFTLLLLVLLAVYDFISVYKTKHMIALADSVVEAKMPILLVFPMKWSYRYEDETNLMDPKRKRESLFMGLGDVIIPGILILSAATFLSPVGGTRLFGFIYPPVGVALFTLIGMLIGWGSLMFFVLKGKAHAGLPPINSGTILGFIIGHLLIYGTFVFW